MQPHFKNLILKKMSEEEVQEMADEIQMLNDKDLIIVVREAIANLSQRAFMRADYDDMREQLNDFNSELEEIEKEL